MNEKEIIREALSRREKTQVELAKLCGYTSQGVISNLLNRSNSMRVDIFVWMMDKLGYRVIVEDKGTGDRLGEIEVRVEEPKKYKRRDE